MAKCLYNWPMATKLEAEKDVKRDQKSVGMKPSIKELFKRK